ncbi:MAG: heparinase II/III family protein [bacterium]
MQITAINEAEAILDPFWDPAMSELDQWRIEPGPDHGLVMRQNWCWAEFEWVRRPVSGPSLRMRRACGVTCGDYDRLVLSVMAPEEAVVRIVAETDRGLRRLDAPPAGLKKKELALELEGATRLDAVTIEVEAGADGIAQGWFNWLGLQHSGRLAHMLKTQSGWGARWEKHLKDEAFEPAFAPSYGLLLNGGELAALRERHEAMMAQGLASPFLAAAEAAKADPPESLIGDFVSFWGDTRYNRERDHGHQLLAHGVNAAIAGHLRRDKRLLRLAARYALSIAMCKNWDDGFICRFPGGTFEHRCFVQSLCAFDVAAILDLAGECFTDTGREFLLRRLAEESIGAIQFNTWKHDYIFGCNQLGWFTPGRVLALAVLNRHWPRVRPYLDIAYRELCESLERSILPDGGYVEGPTYFRCVGRDAGLGVYFYSRALGRPMAELIPPTMTRCGDLAEALISTDNGSDLIPICDGRPLHEFLSQAVMATLLPDSAWARMLRKALDRHNGRPFSDLVPGFVPMLADAAIAWSLVGGLPDQAADPRPVVRLPDMGPLVSQRRLGDAWVKLFIQGNHAGAGHTHEDKGSFVLEFAGETFAMDPGTCDYSHPLAGALTNCERHNMLVPYGTAERPHPACPLPHDVKPMGVGDATSFSAEIDATPGWEPYYRRWRRTWESPTPDVLAISDDYELAAGEGVEFYWQTRMPVAIEGRRAVITGERGRVTLEVPANRAWRLDELPLLDGVQRRLTIREQGMSGRLTVQVHLAPV